MSRSLSLFALGLVLSLPASVQAAASRASFNHVPSEEARAGEVFRIEGSLASTAPFRRLVVKVRGPGEAWEEVELELQYGDLYRATLPASRMVSPGVEYFVEGVQADGDRVPLLASEASPLRLNVAGKGSWAPDKKEPAPEKPAEVKPKCKKGKRCDDARPPEKVEKPVEKPAVVERPVPERTPEPVAHPEPARRDPPVRVEPASDRPSPPRRRTELDEELAVYAAEDASGVAQHLETRSKQSVLTPSVITAAQLQQMGVRYVYEALQNVPGLSVSRDVQGFWRVAVRGVRSDAEVLVLLDGLPLNAFFDGRALGNLPVDTLERIEVSRGPAGLDVGPGDVLAVVSLWTNREAGVRASASGGLYQALDGHLSAAQDVGPLKLFVAGDVASQQGSMRPVAKDGLDTATVVRPKTTTDHRFLVSVGGGAAFTHEAIGSLEVSARLLTESRSALLGAFDVVGADSKLAWELMQGQVAWKKPLGEGGSVGVRVWLTQQATDRLWQMTPDGYQARAGASETLFPDGMLDQVKVGERSLGLDGRLELPLPANNRLVAGVRGAFRSLTGYDWLTNTEAGTNKYLGTTLIRAAGLTYPTEDGKGGRGKAADRLELGLYAADTWTPTDSVTIHAGVRGDVTQLPTVDATGAFTGQGFVPSFGPRVGVAIAPTPDFVARLAYGRSFRAPTVQELAEQVPATDSNQGRFIGNHQLEGAYLDAVEASGEYVQGVGDGKLRMRGTFFYDRFSNPIAMVDSTGNLMPYTNRPEGVQALGIEGDARLELGRRMQVWGNVSWVRAEDLGTPASARLLTDVPQARFNVGLTLPFGPWLLIDLSTSYASERRNASRSVLELIRRYTLPGYSTVMAQLRTEPLFDHLELAVTGQNVFSFDYADDAIRPDRITAGVPRDLVLVFGSAKVRF